MKNYRKKYVALKKAVRRFIEIEGRIFGSSNVPYVYDDMEAARKVLCKLTTGKSDLEEAALSVRAKMPPAKPKVEAPKPVRYRMKRKK